MNRERLAQVWPDWRIEEQLGKGSYGVVYKAVREGNNIRSHAAIKVISIPTDQAELDSLRSEGLSEEGARTYFKGIVDDFVGEIQLMETLKGVQNIVSVEDYKVVERTGEVGWDIYIRMELLKPFNSYICNKQMTEREVVKLGMDICTALELCSQRKVVHRDIKPENIFINDFGYFKLGDFGIARKLENATGGMSQKGTFNYMAPEVATGTRYDARVDLYSLGVVLYRLLNGNKLPFIENEQQLLNPNARKMAVERRIRGEQFAPPSQASAQVAAVIMRACAFRPEMRFSSATEMKNALLAASMGRYVVKAPVAQQPQQNRATTQPARGPAPAYQAVTPNAYRANTNGSGNFGNSTPPNYGVNSTPRNYGVNSIPRNTNMTGSGSVQIKPPVKKETSKRLSAASLVGFILSMQLLLLALIGTGFSMEEHIFIYSVLVLVVAAVAMLLLIVGIGCARKHKRKGKGFAFVGYIFTLIVSIITIDKLCVAMEDLRMITRGSDLVVSITTCSVTAVVTALLFLLVGRSKKK